LAVLGELLDSGRHLRDDPSVALASPVADSHERDPHLRPQGCLAIPARLRLKGVGDDHGPAGVDLAGELVEADALLRLIARHGPVNRAERLAVPLAPAADSLGDVPADRLRAAAAAHVAAQGGDEDGRRGGLVLHLQKSENTAPSRSV